MKGVMLAWLTTIGIIAFEDATKEHHAPIPSELFLPSVLFMGLGVVSEIGPLDKAAGAAAWGLVVLAFLSRQGTYQGPGSGIFGGGSQQSQSSGQDRSHPSGHVPPGRGGTHPGIPVTQ